MADIAVKQKEAKTIEFTVTDADGAAVNLTGATLKFAVKLTIDQTTYDIEKDTVDFDVGQAASGIVALPLSATDLDLAAGDYQSELKVVISGDNIDKSNTLTFYVEPAVITD